MCVVWGVCWGTGVCVSLVHVGWVGGAHVQV